MEFTGSNSSLPAHRIRQWCESTRNYLIETNDPCFFLLALEYRGPVDLLTILKCNQYHDSPYICSGDPQWIAVQHYQVQYNLKPLRCQRTRVSGLKIANV